METLYSSFDIQTDNATGYSNRSFVDLSFSSNLNNL